MPNRGREATAGKSGPSRKYRRGLALRRFEHRPFLQDEAISDERLTNKIPGDGLTPGTLILAYESNDLRCG
jgi:hypothetical protein